MKKIILYTFWIVPLLLLLFLLIPPLDCVFPKRTAVEGLWINADYSPGNKEKRILSIKRGYAYYVYRCDDDSWSETTIDHGRYSCNYPTVHLTSKRQVEYSCTFMGDSLLLFYKGHQEEHQVTFKRLKGFRYIIHFYSL